MLVFYILLMAYLIGGLNILKLKFLFPCLEDLCSIYAEVEKAHAAPALLLKVDHLLVLHVSRPVLLRDVQHLHEPRSLRLADLLLLRGASLLAHFRREHAGDLRL